MPATFHCHLLPLTSHLWHATSQLPPATCVVTAAIVCKSGQDGRHSAAHITTATAASIALTVDASAAVTTAKAGYKSIRGCHHVREGGLQI